MTAAEFPTATSSTATTATTSTNNTNDSPRRHPYASLPTPDSNDSRSRGPLLQNAPVHCLQHTHLLSAMPTPYSSQTAQQQQRPGNLNQRNGLPDEDLCPDPRLATAAAAAAALKASSSTATTTPAIPSAAVGTASTGNGLTSFQRLVKQYRIEVAASASSVLSTLTTFPLDSVKTRMQTYRYAGFLDCVRHTYQREHLRGFFRGMGLT